MKTGRGNWGLPVKGLERQRIWLKPMEDLQTSTAAWCCKHCWVTRVGAGGWLLGQAEK